MEKQTKRLEKSKEIHPKLQSQANELEPKLKSYSEPLKELLNRLHLLNATKQYFLTLEKVQNLVYLFLFLFRLLFQFQKKKIKY